MLLIQQHSKATFILALVLGLSACGTVSPDQSLFQIGHSLECQHQEKHHPYQENKACHASTTSDFQAYQTQRQALLQEGD